MYMASLMDICPFFELGPMYICWHTSAFRAASLSFRYHGSTLCSPALRNKGPVNGINKKRAHAPVIRCCRCFDRMLNASHFLFGTSQTYHALWYSAGCTTSLPFPRASGLNNHIHRRGYLLSSGHLCCHTIKANCTRQGNQAC